MLDCTLHSRYSFQGQEHDDEVKGKGNSINYKYRMHDPRIGRFFAIDPLAHEYPFNSAYAFGQNSVIEFIELEGAEAHENDGHKNSRGESLLSISEKMSQMDIYQVGHAYLETNMYYRNVTLNTSNGRLGDNGTFVVPSHQLKIYPPSEKNGRYKVEVLPFSRKSDDGSYMSIDRDYVGTHYLNGKPEFSAAEFVYAKMKKGTKYSGEEWQSTHIGRGMPTWCNMFAKDLAEEFTGQKVLPWKNANGMNNYMNANLDLFMEVDVKDAWIYANDGYLVFISYNSGSSSPGHIATALPTEEDYLNENDGYGMIGQAGAQVGVFPQTTIFKRIQNKTQAFVYTGYSRCATIDIRKPVTPEPGEAQNRVEINYKSVLE